MSTFWTLAHRLDSAPLGAQTKRIFYLNELRPQGLVVAAVLYLTHNAQV